MGIIQIKEWYRRFKNGTSKSEPRQVNAYYFFRLWGCCALRICSKRSDDQQRILRWVLKKLRDNDNDNEPAHSSNLVHQFLAKYKILQLRQPPYSLDIASCEFWIFPKLKMALKGKRSTIQIFELKNITLRKKNIWIKEYFFDSNKWLSWMVTNKYFFRSKKYFYCL